MLHACLQVLQWVFAGAPGHPVLREICDHIATHATTVFSNNTNRDTLERTGPGVWTDVILRHALQHPPAKVNNLGTLPVVTGMPRHISIDTFKLAMQCVECGACVL